PDRHDDLDRPRRIGLRPCDARHGRQRGSTGGQTEKISTGKFHSTLPAFGSITLSGFHSGLMLAARITFAHFSVSSARSFPKSAGESASTSPPMSASRAFILGSASAALISLLSLSTISVGVFLGAPRPYTELAS